MSDVLVDLSHVLEPGMPAYPGLPVPHFGTYFTHAESLERGNYAPGTSFQIATYEMPGNTGTYIDSPFHRWPDAADLAGLPLKKLANLPGVLITALQEGPITPEKFQNLDLQGKAVLIRTDWSQRWGGNDYFRSGPFLPAATCELLVAAQPAVVGIDCANIDDMTDSSRPAHSILLKAGIPIVEHLANLEQLSSVGGFRFFAVPPAVRGGTTFTVRAFALVSGV